MLKKLNKWKKLGKIFEPSAKHSLLMSHAANPLAVYLCNNSYRIYFSGRDKENRSSVCYIDFDIEKLDVVYEHLEPIFQFGGMESFYSHGVSIGNSYRSGMKNYILFMGWQLPDGGHWRGDIGRLEIKEDKLNLDLSPEQVFMGVDSEDPISLSYPWVLEKDGEYKMWYGSTVKWHTENGEMLHVIKYATSEDGDKWEKHGQVIESKLGIAQAFSRPTVLYINGFYHMWYSYRRGDGSKYRIGYSTSENGFKWTNHLNEVGLDSSDAGWDSEMICYPFVFQHNQKIFMLYNGNQHGRTGFGLAELITT